MSSFNDRIMNSDSIKHLDSILVRIAEDAARTLPAEDGMGLGAESHVHNRHLGAGHQIEPVDEYGITSAIPIETANPKLKSGPRKWRREQREERERLDGTARLHNRHIVQAKKDKRKSKRKNKNRRKALKKESSEQAHDTNDHSEDISILDSDNSPQEGIGNMSKTDVPTVSKPAKETRIVPVKVDGIWQYPTVRSEPRSLQSPISSHALARVSTMILRRDLSADTDSGEDASRTKRTQLAHDSEDPITPTRTTRVKNKDVESEIPQDLSDSELASVDEGEEQRSPTPSISGGNGASPGPSNASASESEQSSPSHGTRWCRQNTENCEVVSPTWQRTPGKLRGRLESSNDSEAEENIAFSSEYLLKQGMGGVTISGMKFRVLLVTRGMTEELYGSKYNMLELISVMRGYPGIHLCGKAFNLGPGGMWRRRGPEYCKITAPDDGEDVVLQISSIEIK